MLRTPADAQSMSVITTAVIVQSEKMRTLGNPDYGRQGLETAEQLGSGWGTKYGSCLWLGEWGVSQ